MNKNATCPLCDTSNKIINSHILPEGFYRNIYDEDRAIFISKNRSMKKKIQQGFKQRLLCENCDRKIIGPYDKYAIETIRDKKHINLSTGMGVEIWQEFDTQKIKKFFLSLIFKAHLSRKIPYEKVEIDSDLIDPIKNYLQNKKIPDESFNLFAEALIDPNNGKPITGFVTAINVSELLPTDSAKVYSCIISGFCWHFIASEKKIENEYEKFFLSSKGKMLSPRINMFSSKLFMASYRSMTKASGE